MSYTREKGIAFWYDFDNRTLHQRRNHPEIMAAIAAAYGPFGFNLDAPVELFRSSFSRADHPRLFADGLPLAGFRRLADEQQRIFESHFEDQNDRLAAFIDFGQGVLYDNRRPRSADILIHMMDGPPTDWVGYHRWQAFIRGALLGNADAEFWNHLLRCVAVAWTIQTQADPIIDATDNPGLSASRCQAIADFWLAADDKFIDRSFVRYIAAPSLEELRTMSGPPDGAGMGIAGKPLTYQQVQAILERATPTGNPMHGAKRRFWLLQLNQFLAIGKIRGIQLIADPGPNRGARSGLIRALKGEGEFGDGVDAFIPRMPKDLPPMQDAEIAYIENWIDADCPA